jgi:23S rRNA pseudouridine1911/1915/1917 synthase
LDIDHPITGERMHFESELPADMQTVLEKWRHYTAYKPLGNDDDEEPLDKEAVNNMK